MNKCITYDALGNRTSVVNGGTTNYDSNSLNQYTSVGGESYRYDKNGNLTDINSAQYEYVYDCENRLIEAKENGSTVAAYKYDYAGRRVRKIVYGEPNVVTGYLYDGDQVIGEYDVNGTTYTLLRKFYYGPGIDEPVCMIDVAHGNAIYYYHYDGLGSVVAMTDVNGSVIESYEYDIFGQPTIWDVNAGTDVDSSIVGNPYMFTGRRFDTETGLYYYRARYYEPKLGRFLQTDPIGYYAGLNLYTYVDNNPLNWIDPWGLWNLRFGGGFGPAGQINIGRNSGQWSVSFNVGFGAGAIVSFDSTDTGATMAGSGGGVNTTLNASGQLGPIAGGSVDFTAHGTIGSEGIASGADVSGGASVAGVGATGHVHGEVGDGGATGGATAGGTVGIGGMGFVGAGGHATWGGDGSDNNSGKK